jgi:hypothetical protein
MPHVFIYKEALFYWGQLVRRLWQHRLWSGRWANLSLQSRKDFIIRQPSHRAAWQRWLDRSWSARSSHDTTAAATGRSGRTSAVEGRAQNAAHDSINLRRFLNTSERA